MAGECYHSATMAPKSYLRSLSGQVVDILSILSGILLSIIKGKMVKK